MTNVMHKFYSMYLFLFINLYMFRAHRAHHQERQIVSIQPLVTVTLCWWPCRVHTTRTPTQSDSYQRLYWCNFSLLMMSTRCSKHVESYKQKNKHIERNLCVTLVIYQELLSLVILVPTLQNITIIHTVCQSISVINLLSIYPPLFSAC